MRTLGQVSAHGGISVPGDTGPVITDGGATVVTAYPSGSLQVLPSVEIGRPDISMDPGLAPEWYRPEFDLDTDGNDYLDIEPPPEVGIYEDNDNGVDIEPYTPPTEAGLRDLLGLDDPDSFLGQHGKKVAIGAGVAGAVLGLYLIFRR